MRPAAYPVHGERTPPKIGRELRPRTGPPAAEWDRLPACQPRTGRMPVPLFEVHGKPPNPFARARVFSFADAKRWSSCFSMWAARNSLKAELQHVRRTNPKDLVARAGGRSESCCDN